MAKIVPIRGIRYTPVGGDLSDLLAPPYDVVTRAQQLDLLERSPYNALHLELPGDTSDRYDAAAITLRDWVGRGVIARDPNANFYVYEQGFVDQGVKRQRRCVLAGVEAQPWDEGAVKPHEFTMSGPKDDRRRLLEATRVQFSPVMMIARDRAGHLRQIIDEALQRAPDEEATVDGESHRLWLVPGDSYTRRRLAPLNSESFYIADGHHRYETAVTYKLSRLAAGHLEDDHPARFVFAGIVAAGDPGLFIRPIHRIVPRRAPENWRESVEEVFEVASVPAGADPATTARALLRGHPRSIVAAGLESGTFHVLTTRSDDAIGSRTPRGYSSVWANLQPNVVRYGLLEPLWGIDDDALRAGAVEYTHDEQEALGAIVSSSAAVVFLTQAVSVDEVTTLADRGERMPQKSTFFHPKLATGLVFHQLDY